MHYIEPDGMMMHLDQSTEPYDDREEMPMPDTPKVTPKAQAMWAVCDKDGMHMVASHAAAVAESIAGVCAKNGERAVVVAGVFVPMPCTAAMVEAACVEAVRVQGHKFDVFDEPSKQVCRDAMRAALNAVLSPEGGA